MSDELRVWKVTFGASMPEKLVGTISISQDVKAISMAHAEGAAIDVVFGKGQTGARRRFLRACIVSVEDLGPYKLSPVVISWPG